MKIITSAGEITAVQHSELEDVVVVRGNTDALTAVVDGMIQSGAIHDDYGYPVSSFITVDKELFAVWVQYEILNFLTYTDLAEANIT